MPQTLSELMDTDERSPLADEEIDDTLWGMLCDLITTPADLGTYERPVAVYFASRFLQWEVGNGGFSQAAFNIPEWFELAARGYTALGKPHHSALIREVHSLLPDNAELAEKLRSGEIEWEEYFKDHDFDVYNGRAFDSDDWECDAERIQYVRVNRDAFRRVDGGASDPG